MKAWLPTIASFCTVVAATVAIVTFMQAEHGQLRADMREMRTEMREEHAEMRNRLNSIDRRASRIEGHLFGIEIPQEPADEE